MSMNSTMGREVPAWLAILLGLVFIAVGVIVLGDVVFATIISAFVIGVCAIVGGAFEIVHAFWTKGWGGFIWQIILGVLYIAGGVVLIQQPVAGALVLTWLLGVFILASGVVRIFLGFKHWAVAGWLLLISGIFGVIAGVIILSGFPTTGLWVIGLLIGIDLIMHGIGWLVLAVQPSARATA
ncbi:MAG: HdeD family acid-resistance protein [Rhizobiaceae bacterium]|nr:HdeD family acid-resistance protein [Rhizobiaceae bacterium]